ncbi:MetQ/NlpA family ABC transporter substrate-binding protein [Enterococcus sp. LJL99]
MKKKIILGSILLGLVVFSACGNKSSESEDKEEQKKEIRVGTSPGPYSELFTDAIKPILEKEGYEIKETEFTELIQADVALSEGSIDLNVDQHTAYLNNFNENKGTDLVGITSIPTVPAGLFPGRKQSLEEVKTGDKIGIPDDASNTARALNLLQKAGWIELDGDTESVKVTTSDIKKNLKGVELVEMNSAQIPRSLADLDYAVIPGSIVYSAELNPESSLLSEDVLKQYELVATVDGKNKETDWSKAVVDAYHSDEFKKYIQEHNKNNYWFIPEELKEEK